MKTIKVFLINKESGRITYNPELSSALLDRRIKGLKLDLNDGVDWVDSENKIVKLLLERKQVSTIKTNNDLIAQNDYIKHLKGVSVVFRFSGKCKVQASQKRINAAIDKINKMNNEGL
jgi:hypothetical protein